MQEKNSLPKIYKDKILSATCELSRVMEYLNLAITFNGLWLENAEKENECLWDKVNCMNKILLDTHSHIMDVDSLLDSMAREIMGLSKHTD